MCGNVLEENVKKRGNVQKQGAKGERPRVAREKGAKRNKTEPGGRREELLRGKNKRKKTTHRVDEDRGNKNK